VVALLGFSVSRAVMATQECLWPIGWDALRDVSMGQVMLDGRYPEDPILLNETLWYNPLTGAILALGQKFSGISMPRLNVLIGPFVNLLAPLGLTVLTACLFGRAAALAGLCLVLFGRSPLVPVWVYFSYMPWLMASLYATGLMLVLLALYYNAVMHRSYLRHVAAGLLLGIVFMAHTSAAVVAGGTMLLYVVWEGMRFFRSRVSPCRSVNRVSCPEATEARRTALSFALLLAVAFMASLPYTWSILWNYQFQVRNPAPSLFALDYVLLGQLPDRIREAVNWRNGFAAFGFFSLLYRRNRGDRLVVCWMLTVCLLLIQHYVWQLLENHYAIRLAGIIPGHHGSIHLTAVRAVLFGVGIVSASGLLVRIACHFRSIFGEALSPASFSVPLQITRFTAACIAGILLYSAHPLTTHPDFQPPDMTLYHKYHQRGIPMYEWIMKHTAPDAVFMCNEDDIAMRIVMPAARKLLFPPYIYSNPFVDPGPLSYHNRLLVESVSENNGAAFCEEKSNYSEVYLILREEDLAADTVPHTTLFSEVFRGEGLVLLKARPCEEILQEDGS